jgi:hypothetical protein
MNWLRIVLLRRGMREVSQDLNVPCGVDPVEIKWLSLAVLNNYTI